MRKTKVTLTTGTNSKVQHHQKDLCDINKIMARARRNGYVDPQLIKKRQGIFNELTAVMYSIYDVADAHEAVETAFKSIPANVREKFQNDPTTMFKFINDPKNLAEAVELGLLVPVEAEQKEEEKDEKIEEKK
ncbi:MAG: internal scaffolding protein [Arizlama microvirus]|nr:MAG: internal scaffolding protein [Arizlama microvirus]